MGALLLLAHLLSGTSTAISQYLSYKACVNADFISVDHLRQCGEDVAGKEATIWFADQRAN
jgi:hypothetical protein